MVNKQRKWYSSFYPPEVNFFARSCLELYTTIPAIHGTIMAKAC